MELLNYLHYYINGENPLIVLRKDFMTGEDEPRRLLAGIDHMYEQVILTDLEGGINDNVSFEEIHLIKPALRRIDSLTDEEFLTVGKMNGHPSAQAGKSFVMHSRVHMPSTFHYLLSIHIDLFNLIDSGLAIDAATLSPSTLIATHDNNVNATIIDKA